VLVEDSAISVISTIQTDCWHSCQLLTLSNLFAGLWIKIGHPEQAVGPRSMGSRIGVTGPRVWWIPDGPPASGTSSWNVSSMTWRSNAWRSRECRAGHGPPGPWGLWVKLKGPDEVTAVPCGPRMLKRSRQIESDRTGNQRQNSREKVFYSFLDIFIGTLTVLTNDQSSVVLGFVCTSWFPKSNRQSAGP